MTEKINDDVKKELLINDAEQKLPPVRTGVEMIPVNHEERELIYFHDPQGYMIKPFILDKQISGLLPMLNGQYSVRDINEDLKRYNNHVDDNQLLAFVRQLDEARLLVSPWFRYYKDQVESSFEKATIRPPVCTGQSYPEEKAELTAMLDNAFSENRSSVNEIPERIKALFAPHIDPRVGMASYVKAFKPLCDIKPERVVLLATSHYAGMYHPLYDGSPFILTRKDFETPLGKVSVDKQAVDRLATVSNETGTSFSDRAHRNEHSIELHLIFLQYLWSHSFEIVPILVGSLEEMYYKKDGDIGSKVNKMAETLSEAYGNDDRTLFLISGDLAHIGKKFGDHQPASKMFNDVKSFDGHFMEKAIADAPDDMLQWVGGDYDAYRICGFPPLYTALSALKNLEGQITSYELWDEREQESAVTFGSILYAQSP